ncbi:CGNR zinc finger domain-containing protein [Paenibacillus polymyxa]|uniref:CGNR zinc finger domain-containing protein n=1 Tax=Paenibacillus polymyxa TaxID=1406 RepID=UPI001BEBECD2|nr:CGNR zinc finger domain-containing protein [Paenibacillus polymyxa]MBT2285062.1 CGNR zinc finger domain-containing protein [Paenibacillus polymyxa]
MEAYNDAWFSFTFELINTYDPYYEEPERLGSLALFMELLNKHVLPSAKLPTSKDLIAVHSYRDKFRDLIRTATDEELSLFLNIHLSRAPIQSSLSATTYGQFMYVYDQPDGTEHSLVDSILSICSFVLGMELTKYGRSRLKACASAPCEEMFMDHSKNGLQRFCSKRCSTRYHVKKHRQQNSQ